MEALAIVAYNQPVTRVFVDTLRRADSSYAMNNLLDRGLIECKGRLDVPGRPMLYGTTSDFLRSFGLDGIDKLPETTEEMAALFEKANNTLEQASSADQLEIDTDSIMNTSENIEDNDEIITDEVTDNNDSENIRLVKNITPEAIIDEEPSIEDEPHN